MTSRRSRYYANADDDVLEEDLRRSSTTSLKRRGNRLDQEPPFSDSDSSLYDPNDINDSGDNVAIYPPRRTDPDVGPYIRLGEHYGILEDHDTTWRRDLRAYIHRELATRRKARTWRRRAAALFLCLLATLSLFLTYVMYNSPPFPFPSTLVTSEKSFPPDFTWMFKTPQDILAIPDGVFDLERVERTYKEKMALWAEGGWVCGIKDREKEKRGIAQNSGVVREAVKMFGRVDGELGKDIERGIGNYKERKEVV